MFRKNTPRQKARARYSLRTPAITRRWFDVDSTSFERYGRQMDVETTLCAYWGTVFYFLFC